MLARLRRPVGLLLLAVGALSLASCLSAEERDYVRYDAGRDEFRMLTVLTDIQAKDADDADYLAAIYHNRDHLIAPAFPGGANIFPLFGMNVIRTGDKELAPVNFFSTRPTSLDKTASVVPLDTITVTPGTFFVEGGKLGFFQAYAVPGKTLDLALGEMTKAVQSDDMTKGIQAEIDRRTAGGKTFTWEELKAKTLKGMTLAPDAEPPAGAAPTTAEVEVTPEKVVELDSLKNLLKAATNKELAVTRDKTAMVTTIPLTEKDSAAAADLVKAALARADELAKTPQTAENAEKLLPFKIAQQLGGVAKITAGGKGLTLTVDLLEFTRATTALPAKRIDMNDKKEDEAKFDLVGNLKAKGITPDTTLTADAIVKAFNDGTLKGYPSATPVKPGEGVVKPQPAQP